MKCPNCAALEADEVIDSRTHSDGTFLRRRRKCGSCGARYTTWETHIDPRVFRHQQAQALAIAQALRQMADQLAAWAAQPDVLDDEEVPHGEGDPPTA